MFWQRLPQTTHPASAWQERALVNLTTALVGNPGSARGENRLGDLLREPARAPASAVVTLVDG